MKRSEVNAGISRRAISPRMGGASVRLDLTLAYAQEKLKQQPVMLDHSVNTIHVRPCAQES